MPIWNNDKIINEIYNIFQLFHFTIILKSNFDLHIFIIFIIITIVFVNTILIIFMIYRIKKHKKKILWPIKILKYCLPLLSFGFFGQIFLIFTTIFYCREKELSTSPYLLCRPDHWFNKIKVVGAIGMILHILIALITNLLYYKLNFIVNGSDLLKKTHSFPDIFFLFTKIILIVIFILDKGVESEHWYLLSFLITLTGMNAYINVFYGGRQNKILLSINNFFCLVLFSGFFILFIGKIVKFLNFNGGIFLFFCIVIMILIYIIFFKNNDMDFISKDFKKINNLDEYLQYLTSFYNLIKIKNNSRNNTTIIKTLINSLELNCLQPNCFLKKYLVNLEKGFDFEYLLLQFCEQLFQFGIYKFNRNINIKIYYSMFLTLEMDNKKKAFMILEKLKDEITSIELNYNIYRCRKIIENYSSRYVKKNNSIFFHRMNSMEFKTNVEKTIYLYYDFFSLILNTKIHNINNFEKINKIGYNIKKMNKILENSFDDLINTKANNFEIINLYTEFVENILKDEKKIEKCKIIKKLIFDNNVMIEIHEKDYSNYNLDLLKENYNLQYFIISTGNKNLGKILDCATNLSNILGYQKSELIGNHIDILIPEIYRKKHQIMLLEKTEEYKLNLLQGFYKKSNYSPEFLEKDVYCFSKSKLLIPLNMKIYLVNTEENLIVYIVEVERKIIFNFDLLKKLSEQSSKFCILTDKNFIIQSFTPNCINYLNINYEVINSNINIMNFIKQFREEYLSALKMSVLSKNTQIKQTDLLLLKNSKILNKNTGKKNISYRRKQKIKNDLFNKKYLKRTRITWSNFNDNLFNLTKDEQKTLRMKNTCLENIDTNILFEENLFSNRIPQLEIDLFMETKKIVMDNECLGYYFYFTKINNNENKRYLSYNISREKLTTKELGKFRKYEVIIKSQNFIFNISKNMTGIYKPERLESKKKKSEKSEKIIEKRDAKIKFKEKLKNNKEKRGSKYFSSNKISEINKDEDIIVNENFIPISESNFIFDLNNKSYDYSQEIDKKDNKLNKLLKIEAMEKINTIKKYKTLQIESSIKSESSVEGNENSSSYQNENEESPSSYSKSLKEKKKDNFKTKNDIISKTIGILKDDVNKSNIKNQQNENNKNYYSINLNKIIFMIYDFNKDIIIENDDRNNYISKVEFILNDYKKRLNTINHDNNENYPFILLNKIKKKEEKKYLYKKKQSKEIKENKTIKNNKIINHKDNLLISKIKETINNHNDETPIKKLKIVTILFYIFLICFSFFKFICFLYFSSIIEELYTLIINSLYLKNSNLFSVYYIRELILLHIKVEGIEGGEYLKFPYKNKKKYISLIQENLVDLFKKSQNDMKKIFSTSINFSFNTTKYLYQTKLNIDLLGFNYSSIYTISNIYTALMQYNNAFYNIVFSSKSFEEITNDVTDFIHNSFNNFRKFLDILNNVYNYELKSQKKNLKIITALFLSLLLLIFIIIYILGIINFMSSNLKRISYIEIFYSINIDILRIEILNCLKIINKFETSKNINKNYYYDINEEEVNSFETKEKEINSKMYNNTKNNIGEISNKQVLSFINKLFIIFYGIFILGVYGYFFFGRIFIIKIVRKTINNLQFCSNVLSFQFNIFDMFNAYREYLFDNESIISNMNSYKYLIKKEKEILGSTTENFKKTYFTLIKIKDTNPEMFQALNMHYCSFSTTDYFNSFEECLMKYKNILNLDFYDFLDYFLEQIRIKKNVAKYLLENENVVGNLTKYNKININKIFETNNSSNAMFRLNLFNDDFLHSELNILYFNIIFPYLKNIGIIFRFYGGIDEEKNLFKLVFLGFILIISIIFYFCFFHLINFFNKQIYKTKNMLSIIPINFLLYNSNIKSFVNLLINEN